MDQSQSQFQIQQNKKSNSLILSAIYGVEKFLELLSGQDPVGKVSIELIKWQLAIIWNTEQVWAFIIITKKIKNTDCIATVRVISVSLDNQPEILKKRKDLCLFGLILILIYAHAAKLNLQMNKITCCIWCALTTLETSFEPIVSLVLSCIIPLLLFLVWRHTNLTTWRAPFNTKGVIYRIFPLCYLCTWLLSTTQSTVW